MPAPHDSEKRKIWIKNQSKAHIGKKGYWFGKKRPLYSQEWIDNISKALKGKYVGLNSSNWKEKLHKICIVCKKPFDVVPSLEWRRCCSNKCAGKLQSERVKGQKHPMWGKTGSESPSWIDGRSYFRYPREFFKIRDSRDIHRRDGYCCQLCGLPEIEEIGGNHLSIHHIDGNRYNNNFSNLITLCVVCNGKVDFNKKKWEKYFQKRIEMGVKERQLCLSS